MNKLHRYIAYAFYFVAVLCVSTVCLAQSPFNGTWHTDLAQSRFSRRPDSFYIGRGWYHCVSCTPSFTVPADGHFHVVHHQAFDMIKIKINSPHTITITTRRFGSIDFQQIRTVSNHSKTLTVKTMVYPRDRAKTYSYTVVCRRQGPVPSDVQPTSGSWILEKITGHPGAMTTTLKVTAKEMTLTNPTGESFTAQFNGKDYPVKGSNFFNQVALKRVNPHTIKATDLRDGKVVEKDTMTVHGNTLTVVATKEPSQSTSTYVAHKG